MDSYTWEDAVLWLMNQPEKKRLAEQCYFYKNPLEAGRKYKQSGEFKEILNLIKKFKQYNYRKVLDIGAGNGIASYAFAKNGYKVFALVPDESKIVGTGAIKKIKNEADLPIKIIKGYAENISLEDNSIDLVFARQALHHAENLDKFNSEIYRILKKNGLYVTCRDHVINNAAQKKAFLTSHPLHHKYGGENAYSIENYKLSFKKAGFHILEEISTLENPINYFPMSKTDVKKIKHSLLYKNYGRWYLAKLIGYIPKWDSLFNKILSKKYNKPGRLYSFILTKT